MISTVRFQLALLALGATACALTHEQGDTTEVASSGTRVDCAAERCVGDERDRPPPPVPHDDCPTEPHDPSRAAALIDLVAVQAPGGGPATKGDPIELVLDLDAAWSGTLHVTPRLTHATLPEFVDVPLATTPVDVHCGVQRVTVRGGPFLASLDERAQFALASGDYQIGSIAFTRDAPTTDEDMDPVPTAQLATARFLVRTSNALLVPVLFDPGYLTGITGNPHATPESYLQATFHRPSQITAGAGAPVTTHAGGFDEMMNVRHVFRVFPSMPPSNPTRDSWCEHAARHARAVLGLGRAWGERTARHGFDYLLGLTPALGGGVACPWLDSQVSGFIDRDLDRQQIIVVHETGHLFGAPHCDDVGDGRGGPLQGYVMCSGEKHAHYPAHFVWHQSSRDAMRSHWR